MEATEKQINYAQKLGIDNPEQYTKQALSQMIDSKQSGTSGFSKPSTSSQASNTAKHDIIISRTEKPHSFEFGKPGKRHKIYYGEIAELQEHIQALKAQGLAEEGDLHDVEKIA